MWRPAATCEALGYAPLLKAGWAHTAGVERIPAVEASTRPEVILTGRPSTQWASNTRCGCVETGLLF